MLKISPPLGFDPRTAQLVASRYTGSFSETPGKSFMVPRGDPTAILENAKLEYRKCFSPITHRMIKQRKHGM